MGHKMMYSTDSRYYPGIIELEDQLYFKGRQHQSNRGRGEKWCPSGCGRHEEQIYPLCGYKGFYWTMVCQDGGGVEILGSEQQSVHEYTRDQEAGSDTPMPAAPAQKKAGTRIAPAGIITSKDDNTKLLASGCSLAMPLTGFGSTAIWRLAGVSIIMAPGIGISNPAV